MGFQRRVLYFFDYFYPAYKSGGPSRSSLGLIENLRDYLDIHVVTNAYDAGEKQTLTGIKPGVWNKIKGVDVLYLSKRSHSTLLKEIKKIKPDIYHFNSFFSFRFTIIPLLLIKKKLLPARPIVISPRGELSESALQIKKLKKGVYLNLFRILKSRIFFHATTEQEKCDIIRTLNIDRSRVYVAANLRSPHDYKIEFTPSQKSPDILKMVFVARIVPIKNLEFCIKVLQHVETNVLFDCYGIMEDKEYFEEILRKAVSLPEKVQFNYKGELPQNKVIDCMKGYDILFFPSKSENFGHTILESFLASRPVLISDQTYWKNLQPDLAGWDISLQYPENFARVIEELSVLDKVMFEKFAVAAFDKGKNFVSNCDHTLSYLKLYEKALETH